MNSLQIRNLHAAAARILPSDDGPGATETRAALFIERALAERLSGPPQERFLRGLDLLEQLAQDLHGQSFCDGAAEQQDAVLARLLEVPHRLPRRFLTMLLNLTLQGFLGDPKYGGNHEALGWHYLGIQDTR